MYPSTAWNKHFLHAIYLRLFEEKDNYKVMFYFLSPNVLLLLIFLILKIKLFLANKRDLVLHLKHGRKVVIIP